MSCHVMSCHVMSCHVMSCHVMSCHMCVYVRVFACLRVLFACFVCVFCGVCLFVSCLCVCMPFNVTSHVL